MTAFGLCACVSAPKATPLARSTAPSAVIVEANQAANAPGVYPRFSAIPPPPTDVRPDAAWRSAVATEWTLKKTTEAEAAQIPFTLSDSEAWAERQQALIPPSETTPPATGSAAETQAYADSLRARATPPPPPN
jgi:hypothetical protein